MFQSDCGEYAKAPCNNFALTIMSATIKSKMKYFGGLVCVFGGIYLGNAYGASYWRFGPLNLAWDTMFRGTVLVVIGLMLIRFSK